MTRPALRATFATLALPAGVPVELARRVTGHATVEVVLKHYFHPGRDALRAALANAMPKVLTVGRGAPSKSGTCISQRFFAPSPNPRLTHPFQRSMIAALSMGYAWHRLLTL